MAGAQLLAREKCNLIVAVGGGSPLDCAKGIGIVSSNDRHICDFEGVDRVAQPMPPLICIPTTSGSSADVSQFAIINDETRRVKMAIVSKTLVPDLALIDSVDAGYHAGLSVCLHRYGCVDSCGGGLCIQCQLVDYRFATRWKPFV